MKNIHVKGVSDSDHALVKARAKRHGMTIGGYLLTLVRLESEKPLRITFRPREQGKRQEDPFA